MLLIPQIRNLKSLTWNAGPIAQDILAALEKSHPSCTLRVFNWWRFNGSVNYLDEAELSLARFANLTHFRYNAHYELLYAWDTFKYIVSNSRALEFASFCSKMHVEHSDSPHWMQESAEPRAGRRKSKGLKALTIDSPDVPLASSWIAQELASFIDLSNLESVKLSRGRLDMSYFSQAATVLPNLKHVSLNFTQSSSAQLAESASEYLRNCSPLRTLSLWGWSSVMTVSDIVARHGQTLEVLQLHEREQDATGRTRPVLSLADIKFLRSSCPRLQDLTLDINSQNQQFNILSEAENLEFLNALAHEGPRLRKIQLYLDCAQLMQWTQTRLSNDPELYNILADHPDMRDLEKKIRKAQRDLYEPLLSPYVEGIWHLLYARQTAGERLLDVKLGNWESKMARLSAVVDQRIFFQVGPNERDDRQGECTVRMRLWQFNNARGV